MRRRGCRAGVKDSPARQCFPVAQECDGTETRDKVTPGAFAPGVIIYWIRKAGGFMADNKTCYRLCFNN